MPLLSPIRRALSARVAAATVLVAAVVAPAAGQGTTATNSDIEAPEVTRLTLKGVKHVDPAELQQSMATVASHCRSMLLKPFCLVSKSHYFYQREFLDRTEFKRDVLRIKIFYWKRGYREAQVDTTHNHVRLESFEDTSRWIHRKGACSAHAGVAGVIPGSMGSPTFHVEGRGCVEALCSSSHGAGRALSRSEARARVTARSLRAQVRGVHVPDGDLREEAPAAYKDIGAVMRAQRDLVRVTRRLRPRLVWRGG